MILGFPFMILANEKRFRMAIGENEKSVERLAL